MGVIRDQVAEATGAFAAVFRNRDLRRVNLALAGSVVGDWAYGIAISVWAYGQGGATAVGVFAVVRFVSLALVSPFASSLADRFERKRVMIVADVVRLVLVGVGALLVTIDAPAVTIYAMALVTSLVGSAFRPAQAALVPTLADSPAQLTHTNVVASTIESVGFFVGPAIAAFFLALTNLQTVLVFNAATFLWSALVLVRVGPPREGAVSVDDEGSGEDDADRDTDATSEPGDDFGEGVLAGFRFLRSNRDLRLVAFLMAAQTLVAGASLVFEVAIVFELLEKGESTLGLVNAVLGVGGLVGGVVAVLLAKRERMAVDFGIGVIAWGAPLLLIVVWPSLAAVVLAYVVIGMANSIVDVNAYTMVQRMTPESVMGRMFGALETVLIVGMALGSLVMPLLIAWIDVRWSLALVGGVTAALALSSLRKLDDMDKRVLAPPLLSLLTEVPIFAPLPRPAQERIARSLEPRRFAAGEVVFRQGDPGDHYWLIQSGRVSIEIDGAHRRDLGPGDGFGEIALLRDIPRTATVTAIDDLSLLGIERDDFLHAVSATEDSNAAAENVVNRYLSLG